jgi:putative ABC transport system permease protein
VLTTVGALAALPVVILVLNTRLGFPEGAVTRLDEVRLTTATIVALVAVAVAMGGLLGLLAAARTGSSGAAEALRGGARATVSRQWRRAQGGLVALQIALAFALLLGAGLMTRSFDRLSAIDPGFLPDEGSTFSVALPFRGYDTFQRNAAFHLSVIDALRAQPGITQVAAVMQLPATPQLLSIHPRVEARRRDGTTGEAIVNINVVTSTYFQVMGIPLRAGRNFAPGDLVAATPGIVLGASLARDLFGSEDPVGREVRIASSSRYPSYRVVGVTGDVHGDRVADGPLRTLYYPLLGDLPAGAMEREERMPVMPGGMSYVIRSELPLATLAPMFRQAVASVDPRVPVWGVRTLDSIIERTTTNTRLTMLLLGVSAIVTLVLGAIGLYSVMAYSVAGRVPEFAVRLALGATPREVARLALRQGALLTVAGIGAGVLVSLAGVRVLRGVLYGVSPTDPMILGIAIVVVIASAAAATMPSASRAGDGDPARVLRGG